MLHSNRLSTRSMPSLLTWAAIALTTVTAALGFYEHSHPLPSKDLVSWRDPVAGFGEAFKSKRPIYLFVTTAYKTASGDCSDYVTDFFSDPKLAACINKNFVPVKVIDCHHDHSEKESSAVEDIEQRYGGYTFPRVNIVPFEFQKVTPASYETPQFFDACGPGRKRMYDFIFEYKDWHPIPHSAGEVHWTRLRQAERDSAKTGKPIVYFFVRPYDATSEDMRGQICDDEGFGKTINDVCVPTLVVDYSLIGRKNDPLADELIKRYNVRCFPSFARKEVGQEKAECLIGFPGVDVTLDFIKAGLKGS